MNTGKKSPDNKASGLFFIQGLDPVVIVIQGKEKTTIFAKISEQIIINL